MPKLKRIIPQEIKDLISDMKYEIKYGYLERALEMNYGVKRIIELEIDKEKAEWAEKKT